MELSFKEVMQILDAAKYTTRESRHVEYQTHQVNTKEITFVCQP